MDGKLPVAHCEGKPDLKLLSPGMASPSGSPLPTYTHTLCGGRQPQFGMEKATSSYPLEAI